jgi:hypothetical protein
VIFLPFLKINANLTGFPAFLRLRRADPPAFDFAKGDVGRVAGREPAIFSVIPHKAGGTIFEPSGSLDKTGWVVCLKMA